MKIFFFEIIQKIKSIKKFFTKSFYIQLIKDFFNRITYISDHGYFPFVMKFIKSTIFFAGFECLISVYILEMLAIMTDFFLYDPTEIPKTIIIIVIPLAIEVAVCVIFGLVYSIIFVNTVYDFSNNIDNEIDGFKTCDGIMKKYRVELKYAHLMGAAMYTFTTMLIPLILIIFHEDKFANLEGLVIFIPLIGTILGGIWNFTGYFRNQRILWHKLLKRFEESEKMIIRKNFKYFILNCIGNVASIITIFVLCIIILANLHSSILKDDPLDKLLGDHNFLIVAFASLVGLYFKILISLIYSSKNENSELFPSLRQMFKMEDKKKKIYRKKYIIK